MNKTNGSNGNNGAKPSHSGLFKKGDPRIWKGGRGKSNKAIPAMLKKLTDDKGKTGDTVLEDICTKLIKAAEEGESWAIQLLFDRMEGRPRQVIQTTTEDEDIGGLSDEQLTHYFDHASRN